MKDTTLLIFAIIGAAIVLYLLYGLACVLLLKIGIFAQNKINESKEQKKRRIHSSFACSDEWYM